MNKLKWLIVLNVELISSIACYNPACNGKFESGVLQFEKRIRRENIRGSMIGKHHYDIKSRQDLVAKADSKRHVINEVPKTEKDDCKSAFNEVSTEKNQSLPHEVVGDLQKRAVKHQPKLTDKMEKNSKLGKQSTNEMKNLLMAKLVALLKPIKKVNDPAPKREYITLRRKKRYSNQNDYYVTPDQQILCMGENPLYNEKENIVPERYLNQKDYVLKSQQSYIDKSDYLPYGVPKWKPSDIVGLGLFSGQTSTKANINTIQPVAPSLENQVRYIDESRYLPPVKPDCIPSDIVALASFSGKTSSKANINKIQPVAPSLQKQERYIDGRLFLPTVKPDWKPSDIGALGSFSGQTLSKPNINTIQPVAPSLENQERYISGRRFFPPAKPNWKTSNIVALASFSGKTSSKANINKIQPVARSIENQERYIDGRRYLPTVKPDWKPSDIEAHWTFSGQTLSKQNINTNQPVAPSLENQERYIDGRLFLPTVKPDWKPSDVGALGSLSKQTLSKPNINTIEPVAPSLEYQERYIGGRRFFPPAKPDWETSDIEPLGSISGQTLSKPNENQIQPVTPPLQNPLEQLKRYFDESGYLPTEKPKWKPDITNGSFAGQTLPEPNENTIPPVAPSPENPLQNQQNYGNENLSSEKRRWKSSDVARGSFSSRKQKGPFVIIL